MMVLKRIVALLCSLVLIAMLLPGAAIADGSDYATIETSVDLINLLMASEDYQYNLSGSTDGFILKTSSPDAASAIRLLLLFEVQPEKEEMNIIEETMRSLSSNAQEQVLTLCGIKNPNMLVLFTDDQDQNIIYFAMFNGQIIYDVFNID